MRAAWNADVEVPCGDLRLGAKDDSAVHLEVKRRSSPKRMSGLREIHRLSKKYPFGSSGRSEAVSRGEFQGVRVVEKR